MDIQAFSWCPGLVVVPLECSLHISHKNTECILPVWDMLQPDFYMMPQIRGMDQNGNKAPHGLGTGWVDRQPQLMQPRIYIESAHRFVVLVG